MKCSIATVKHTASTEQVVRGKNVRPDMTNRPGWVAHVAPIKIATQPLSWLIVFNCVILSLTYDQTINKHFEEQMDKVKFSSYNRLSLSRMVTIMGHEVKVACGVFHDVLISWEINLLKTNGPRSNTIWYPSSRLFILFLGVVRVSRLRVFV